MSKIRHCCLLTSGVLALTLYLLTVSTPLTLGKIYTKPIHKDPPPRLIHCQLAPRPILCNLM